MAWEKINDEALKMLKEQKAFEDKVAERLTCLYDSIKNPLVRLFIRRIILDTKRHSDTYQTLIDLDRRALIGESSREKMTEELTSHVEEESKMLEQAKTISMSIKDEKFKRILERVVEDEKIHHKVLHELSGILKKEAEDWNRYAYEMLTGFP